MIVMSEQCRKVFSYLVKRGKININDLFAPLIADPTRWARATLMCEDDVPAAQQRVVVEFVRHSGTPRSVMDFDFSDTTTIVLYDGSLSNKN